MRDFLNSDKGRYLAIAAGAVGALVLAWFAFGVLSEDNASRSADRVFIDAETGDVFRHRLVIGERIPVASPTTGRNTGYLAESCYWTADGGSKDEPTWVLPRTRVDPDAGPTFCPDCNRLVTELNPEPGSGAKAPPTQTEYENRQRPRTQGGGTGAQQSDPRGQ